MNEPSYFNRCKRTAGWGALLWIFSVIPIAAQGISPEGQNQVPGGPLTRMLHGNYAVPVIRSFEPRGEDSLQAMIKDGKLKLTEADVVRLALENNVDINVERYTPYYHLWEVGKGREVLNPTVLFNSNVNRLVTPSSSVLQGGDTVLGLNTAYDLTVHKPFEKGLDVDVNFSVQRARSSSFFLSLNPSLTSNVSVTLTQHLLKDFGGISRTRLLRVARNSLNMSQEDFVGRITDIVTNVLNVYWDLVFDEEEIKVSEASKKLAEVVLDQSKVQAALGTMRPLDVIQAEAEVASRSEQSVVAQYNKRLSENQLKKLISSGSDPGVITATVEPVSEVALPAASLGEVSQAIQRALELRPEVKQVLLDLDNKRIQVDYTRNQLRPSLDLVATYSQNGVGGTRIQRDFSRTLFGAPIVGTEQGGFGDSVDALFSRKYLGYVLGITLKVPVGNDEARANNAQAQITYKQGEGRLRSLRQRIALEVREAYERMEMNQARIGAAVVTVRYNEKRLQVEQDKYSLGETTTRFILEAQRDLREAQSRSLRAKIDLVKSRIAVNKAVGEICGAYNIQVADVLGLFK